MTNETTKNIWIQNSINNLLLLSNSQKFKIALKEWETTGEVIDHGDATSTCELCEHEYLRYHFRIKNSITNNKLWVGSSCIKRFEDIIIRDEQGNPILDKEQRIQKIYKYLNKHNVNKALSSLRELYRADKADKGNFLNYIEMSVKFFKEKGAFMPKNISVLFASMKYRKIKFTPSVSIYPIYLRSNKAKDQLLNLKPSYRHNILTCMSSDQKKRYEKELSIFWSHE
jgi:hypothetical protein